MASFEDRDHSGEHQFHCGERLQHFPEGLLVADISRYEFAATVRYHPKEGEA